ncbi:MAG: cupin domain-containing protein [Phenylobacterium sp.]
MALTPTARTAPTPTETTEGTERSFAGLAALVGPGQVRSFLDQSLGRDALRTALSADEARALFGWARLNAALAEHRLAPPRLRLERGGKDVTRGLFRERRPRRGPPLQDLDPRVLTERLREGATLIIDSASELSAPLRGLCAQLAGEFACACQANLYACWGTTQGFDVHWDDHDVFVVQVEGRKRWALYGMTERAPTRRAAASENRPQTPLEEVVLEPGDVLYLPRGYWHAAVGQGEPTLHLTIGLTRKTGGDFLHWLADHALADAAARTDLPLERDDRILAAHLSGLLARLAAEAPEALAALYRRHVEGHQALRPQLSFPFIGQERAWPPGAGIRLADGIARLSDAEGGCLLSWRGNEFTVDAALAEPLAALVAGETLAYAAMDAALPPDARPHLAAFVSDMVGRGVFQVEPAP